MQQAAIDFHQVLVALGEHTNEEIINPACNSIVCFHVGAKESIHLPESAKLYSNEDDSTVTCEVIGAFSDED